MKKLVVSIIILFLLSGCVSKEGKNIVRSQHALNRVIADRINDPDPNRRPSEQQMQEVIKASASSWESMDRIVNNWKAVGEK